MRYYMVFLLSGKVVDMVEFKDEQTRDMALVRHTHMMYTQTCYDELQVLNLQGN